MIERRAAKIDLAEYLFTRLYEIGVRSVHGVPGDYGIVALDYAYKANLHWVGNASELCAGYAADGYARAKGISAIATSFGVGELGAINAIAGAFAERSPVVHIVGMPPRAAQNAGACLHHSLGNGDFRVFAEMGEKVAVASAILTDPATAASLIDATLRQCILQSRPVRIELPADMVKIEVDAPISSIDLTEPSEPETEGQIAEQILNKIYHSHRPCILVDGFTASCNVRDEVNELVHITGFPTLTTSTGKSIVHESYPNFYGIYFGPIGKPEICEWMTRSDLVLRFGPCNSDVNTLLGATLPDPKVTVLLDKLTVSFPDTTQVAADSCEISLKSVMEKILAGLDKSKIPKVAPISGQKSGSQAILDSLPPPQHDADISQKEFYVQLSTFLRSGDIVLTETGTAYTGGQEMILSKGVTMMTSGLWLSIGAFTGVSQGVSLAQKEMIEEGSRPLGRTILITGDGSIQMAIQSLSDIVRNRLNVTIFILNNNGYTCERLVHGPRQSYNDIQPWRYLEAPHFFGAPRDDASYPVRTTRVQTWGQLLEVFDDKGYQEGNGLNMVEVILDDMQAPEVMSKMTQMLANRNKGAGK